MPQKNIKKVKKKEELPSFLQNLTSRNLDRTLKITKKNLHSNPIFFGECKQFHSTPHPGFFGGVPFPQYSKTSDENIYPDLFLPEHKLPAIAPIAEPVKNRYGKKHTKEFIDHYPHRCPGVRKIFVPEKEVFTPDLGKTTSEIESDTWREIPFCRVKSTLIESPELEVENVMLSDMKEKNRALLPYEQRMAHNHFPKEFITVKLVGPIIPASITITKIPSKRKRMSDFAFEVEEKVDKIKSDTNQVKITAKTNEEIQRGEEEEEEAEEMEIEKVEVEGLEIEEEENEAPGDEKVQEMEESNEEKTEETVVLDEEKIEEARGPGSEKEAGEALENGAPVAASGTILQEEEEEANTADEGENTENDKKE